MVLQATTSSMRSAADRLGRAGHEAESLARAVGDGGALVGSVVEDAGVAASARDALAAVAAQLAVCAAGTEHAAAGVRGSADAYDELDASVAARLTGVGDAG